MSLLYVIARGILRPVQKILWPTKIYNKQYLKDIEGRAILICNHFSTPDSIIIACHFFKRKIHALVKSDAFEKKLAAKALTNVGCISVHRGEGDLTAAKKVLEVLRSDKKLVMFPEGTRNRAGSKEMLPLKPGVALFAYMSHSPIVPMLYYKKHKLFNKNYAMLGKPYRLSDYYEGKPDFEEAAALVTRKFKELREELDFTVENRKRVKR